MENEIEKIEKDRFNDEEEIVDSETLANIEKSLRNLGQEVSELRRQNLLS